ncbi:hypothetical protein VPNG_03582 [Cytospora leucostoma]|uniref:Uncharacterized protein n=1 Tax=Cytospora leucostoma TaxID=1230097 RepID=A0A423XCY9_9PEZI|nr:hypothetical protein VPNG_03582 [Cytospora leucostoma]
MATAEVVSEAAAPANRPNYLARFQALLARVNNLETRDWRPCNCPPNCPGPHGHRKPADPPGSGGGSGSGGSRASSGSGSTRTSTGDPPTARDGTLHPVVNIRLDHRDSAEVYAEARGTIPGIPLSRNGGTGNLRMSLQVHEDVSGFRTRLGYYGEMYLTVPGQRERHIGLISAWRVSRSSGRHSDGTPDWVTEWLQDPEVNNDVQSALTELYDHGGTSKVESGSCDAELFSYLGDEQSDFLYFSLMWITPQFSGQGILDHALYLFYRLLTGGTLPSFYNINYPLVALLHPGKPGAEEISRVWLEFQHPHPAKVGLGHQAVAAKLVRTYQRVGFGYMQESTALGLLGRLVRPVPRDPADHLMMPPDVPPRSAAGHTPPASGKTKPPRPLPAADPETPSRSRKGKEPETRPSAEIAPQPLPGATAQGEEEYEDDDLFGPSPLQSSGQGPSNI